MTKWFFLCEKTTHCILLTNFHYNDTNTFPSLKYLSSLEKKKILYFAYMCLSIQVLILCSETIKIIFIWEILITFAKDNTIFFPSSKNFTILFERLSEKCQSKITENIFM